MEIIVIEEKENPFFKRREIKILMKHSGSSTPAKSEVVKNLASSNSVDESQVVIDYISTKKGLGESVVKAKILKEKPKAEQKVEQKQEVQKVEAQASQSA